VAIMKPNKKYYFTVEGETEHWYLKWLQSQINACVDSKYCVSIDPPVQKNPIKRAKSLSAIGKTTITHVFDYESDEAIHATQFIETLDAMKKSEGIGKQIKYKLGYSNFTFELWIIIHKADCNRSLIHRNQYLEPLNRAYGEHFSTLDEYKHEDNFKRLLRQLSLEDVRNAITRSKTITKINQDNGYLLHNYKNYKYYKENPSLSIWESIEQILIDCGIND